MDVTVDEVMMFLSMFFCPGLGFDPGLFLRSVKARAVSFVSERSLWMTLVYALGSFLLLVGSLGIGLDWPGLAL